MTDGRRPDSGITSRQPQNPLEGRSPRSIDGFPDGGISPVDTWYSVDLIK